MWCNTYILVICPFSFWTEVLGFRSMTPRYPLTQPGLDGTRGPPRLQVDDQEWVCTWLWPQNNEQACWKFLRKVSSLLIKSCRKRSALSVSLKSFSGWRGLDWLHPRVKPELRGNSWGPQDQSAWRPGRSPSTSPHIPANSNQGFCLFHPKASRQRQSPSEILAAVGHWLSAPASDQSSADLRPVSRWRLPVFLRGKYIYDMELKVFPLFSFLKKGIYF